MPKTNRKKLNKKKNEKTATKQKSKTTKAKNQSNSEKQLNELQDKHLRLKAEFENFRRRKADEVSKLLQYDGENVLRGFLAIVDDLERMIKSADSSESSLKDGIIMVQSKIQKYFESLNVENFGEKGDLMDPEIHDAMLTQKDDTFDDGIILDVYEKGYTYRDKVIRHAKVIVNKI